MEQDILYETQELISKLRENQIDSTGQIYLEQLQTLEKIILENDTKAFAFIKPFINKTLDLSKNYLSKGKDRNKEVDLLIKQFDERNIRGDFYDELKTLKIALNTKPFTKSDDWMFNLFVDDIITEATRELTK